jgi:hypothetical protein
LLAQRFISFSMPFLLLQLSAACFAALGVLQGLQSAAQAQASGVMINGLATGIPN